MITEKIFKVKKVSIRKCLNNFLDEEQKSRLEELINSSSRLFCSSSRKLLRHFLILTFFTLKIFSVIILWRLLGLLVSISCLAVLVATSYNCSKISLLNAYTHRVTYQWQLLTYGLHQKFCICTSSPRD